MGSFPPKNRGQDKAFIEKLKAKAKISKEARDQQPALSEDDSFGSDDDGSDDDEDEDEEGPIFDPDSPTVAVIAITSGGRSVGFQLNEDGMLRLNDLTAPLPNWSKTTSLPLGDLDKLATAILRAIPVTKKR